jgi:hypothetical protein
MRTSWFALTAATLACGRGTPDTRDLAATPAVPAPAESTIVIDSSSGFEGVPDSAWFDVKGPVLVAFHPVVSNDSLESDEGLATALDDLAYHIGTAMDSLYAAGFTVTYQGGDTVWLRLPHERVRVLRNADSAEVGYVFADSLGRRVVLYGVRGYTDLIEYAHEFRRTGTIRPR